MITHLQQFLKEASLWSMLNHDNVIPVFGIDFTLFSPDPTTLTPWFNNGSLTDFLASHANSDGLDIVT